MPVLTCSSWPQDGYRSSWHHVLIGNSKGGKGAIKPFLCPETPTPDLPLQLAGQNWEMCPDRENPPQKTLPRMAQPNPKLTPEAGHQTMALLVRRVK